MNGVSETSSLPAKTGNGSHDSYGSKRSGVSTTKPKGGVSTWFRLTGMTLRSLLIDIPLMLLFAAWLSCLVVEHVYHNYVMEVVNSYRRGDLDDFYHHLSNDFTYYNRLCDRSDVTSTQNANDLLIGNDFTGQDGADVMLKHGSVVFSNILSNQTAADLRDYLESRNQIKPDLPFNEKFFAEEDRLALGLGAHDHFSITQALVEVGTHKALQRTLESVLGPDPSVLEISTMTSMKGAPDQGIHSDSDWFGSAVLYSRTFLHSYSLFVALQDTTQEMGATTICPGSHNCANQDLEQVCLDNGAFEVSSNGHTGPDSVLKRGDALLFNQNIWHRGATNRHASDRVMFIVTFGSRTKATPSDYRQQALGTYYYARWNMWGFTYNDLKDAFTVMRPSLGALRGLGLWKPKNRQWGVTWIEQFSRQMANREDFYDYYCLLDFVEWVDEQLKVPEFLQAKLVGDYEEDNFERYLPEMMKKFSNFFAKVNVIVLGVYLVLRMIGSVVIVLLNRRGQQPKQGRSAWFPLWLKRLVLTHGIVALIVWLFLRHVQHTELGQRVKTHRVFDSPYDYNRTCSNDESHPTTLPTRNDVLIGTRFDTEFLGNYNRMLEIHPGNENWMSLVKNFASLHHGAGTLLDAAARFIVDTVSETQENGMVGRFLYQNYADGHWELLSDEKARVETFKALMMQSNSVVKKLGKHLASELADSRFGVGRSTAMAKTFAPLFVRQWEQQVFSLSKKNKSQTSQPSRPLDEHEVMDSTLFSVAALPNKSRAARPASLVETQRRLKRSGIPPKQELDEDEFRVGQVVLADSGNHGRWLEGRIEKVHNDDYYEIWFIASNYYEVVPSESIVLFESFVEGDHVEVGGYSDYWREAAVQRVHPDGTFDVEYSDGGVDTEVHRDHIRPHGLSPLQAGDVATIFEQEEQVLANYKDQGEWFPAVIAEVNDDGTYDVEYDDGDFEESVNVRFVRKAQD